MALSEGTQIVEMARGKGKGKAVSTGARGKAQWRQGLDKLVVARLRKRYPGSIATRKLMARELLRTRRHLEQRVVAMIDADSHLSDAELYQDANEIVPVATSFFGCDGTQAGEMFSPSTRVDTPDMPSAKLMLRKRQTGIKSDIKLHPDRDGGIYTDPCECRSEWCLQCLNQGKSRNVPLAAR